MQTERSEDFDNPIEVKLKKYREDYDRALSDGTGPDELQIISRKIMELKRQLEEHRKPRQDNSKETFRPMDNNSAN